MGTQQWSCRTLFVCILAISSVVLGEHFAIMTLVICQKTAKVNVKLSGMLRQSPQVHFQMRFFWYDLSPLLPTLSVQAPNPKTWGSVIVPPSPNIHPKIESFPLSPKYFSSSHHFLPEHLNGLIIPACPPWIHPPELEWTDWNEELSTSFPS